jgi:hypothetical protein
MSDVTVTTLNDIIIVIVPEGHIQKNIFAPRMAWWKEADHGDKTVLILPRCSHL